MNKKLGKIESVYFGLGGYQDAMIGIHFSFSGDGFGVCDSKCTWDAETIECSQYAKWTEQDRSKQYDEIVRYISKLLKQAKIDSIEKLKGIPVELSLDGNCLKNWRILTEVL